MIRLPKVDSGRILAVWLAVTQLLLSCSAPAFGGVSPKSADGRRLLSLQAGISSDKSQWKNGTWRDGCYVNGKGQVLVRIEDAEAEKLPKIRRIKKYRYLYIGASRTRSTKMAVKDKKVLFYGCGGVGFCWFFHKVRKRYGKFKSAYSVIRAFLKAHPEGTVIIDLGGNDLHNLEAYVGFYRYLLEKYRTARFYFMGILPRDIGEKNYDQRYEFNLRIEKEFPGHEIDLFDRVYTMHGFLPVDGVHYSKKMTRKIYQLTMDAIGRKVKVNLKNGKVRKKKIQ